MNANQHQLNPSELTSDQLERIGYALLPFFQKNMVDQILRKKEAAEFMGISQRQFDRYVVAGKIKSHKLMDDTRDFFLRSEII